MRVVCALADSDPVGTVEEALTVRGHRVQSLEQQTLESVGPELSAADLIVVDAETAARFDLVTKVITNAPGVEFVLVGNTDTGHPDVIDRLARPLDLTQLLRIVDELADVLDSERLGEPVELVAYETLFAGDSPQIRELLRRVRLVARSESPVWIFGDDGSGRPIIARAIHDRSARRQQPFLAFNSAAYSDEELCRRLFEGDDAAIHVARSGTIFIERLAVSGPVTQRELVNYLENRSAEEPGPRFIVGIQRDTAAGGAQTFLSPELFYRLKVLEVEIPSLADRSRDLEQIVGRMLERLAPNGKTTVSAEAMELLARYAFPGNLLELAHALTHAFVLARTGSIVPDHLPITIRKAASDARGTQALEGEVQALDVVAKRFERDYLLRVLRSVDGNRSRAAELLGLSRKGLWGKLKSHGISDDDIDADDA
jgi:DNA-binding NtrC family response regulator